MWSMRCVCGWSSHGDRSSCSTSINHGARILRSDRSSTMLRVRRCCLFTATCATVLPGGTGFLKDYRATGTSRRSVSNPCMRQLRNTRRRCTQRLKNCVRTAVPSASRWSATAWAAWPHAPILRAKGHDAVARVITICTPHHGTVFARFAHGENTRQMRRACDYVRRLAESDEPVEFICFASQHDNLVVPRDSQVLACAEAVWFEKIGHLAMSASDEVLAKLVEVVERPLSQNRRSARRRSHRSPTPTWPCHSLGNDGRTPRSEFLASDWRKQSDPRSLWSSRLPSRPSTHPSPETF